MLNTRLPKHQACTLAGAQRADVLPLHNAAMLYAQAYPSDPFAYKSMRWALSKGQYDREQIVSHAETVIAERRAAVELKFKTWRKSPTRKAVLARLRGAL